MAPIKQVVDTKKTQLKFQTKNWLVESVVTKKKAIIFSVFVYGMLSLFYMNKGKDFVYNQIANPILFKLRNKSDAYPQINTHLKIYAVDQKTMDEAQAEHISAQDWTLLFQALAKSHPKDIFIDKVFSLPVSQDIKIIREFRDAIESANPVTAGAIVTKSKLPTMSELNPKTIGAGLPWLKLSPGYAYGPKVNIADSFAHLGHTNYEGDGFIKPVINYAEGKYIPFWGLNLGEGLSVEDGYLSINKNIIPVDEGGRVLVNLGPEENYWQHTFSLNNLLKMARAGAKLDQIKSDDVVVILTTMYQGTLAVETTPAGTMPKGFIMAEVINSAMNGTWIKISGGELLFLALACLLGAFIGLALGSSWILPTIVFIEVLVFATAYVSFRFYSFHLPWAFPAIGLFSTGLAIFAEKTRLMAASAKVVQVSLEGLVGSQKIKQILRQQGQFSLEPKNQNLTILFIDIVGFSVAAERESPSVVFEYLRSLLSLISEIVHECGGITDRSLGDGLLCFFGYQYSNDIQSGQNHASAALECAIRIQKELLNRDVEAQKKGSIIFPIRIGVNTGEVYVGDLGGKNRIDFTIIGHAVNFAQRLEAACQNYYIMCGATTRDSVEVDSKLSSSLIKKFIPVKNYAGLVEAYELDPFEADSTSRLHRKNLGRTYSVAERNRVRWAAAEGLFSVRLEGIEVVGAIFDFSSTGVGIKIDKYFGKGARISFSIFSTDARLETALREKLLGVLSGEVRWAWADADGSFRTGVQFSNLNLDQENFLVQTLREIQMRRVA